MENFQKWKDIQGSIDGIIELKSWKKVLEKSNQKLKGKVKKKRIEVEEKGLLNLYEDSS